MVLYIVRNSCIFLIMVILSVCTYQAHATESDIIKGIIKIKTYEPRNDGSYVFSSYGSAVAISPKRILTNAHVVLGSGGEPTGLYETCFSVVFEKIPVCRGSARLIAYDITADLALLEISEEGFLIPFALDRDPVTIGMPVSLYGYPAIGGDTITRTEGRIAGYEQAMYKIDANIDHGNSGGAALGGSGKLVGIPTAIASDNAVIGFMIPVRRIRSFLQQETLNYEKFVSKQDRGFIQFLKQKQKLQGDKKYYSWNQVFLRDPKSLGFHIKDNALSADNQLLMIRFVDEYDRVNFTFSCTRDAGVDLGWQARKTGLNWEKSQYEDWEIDTRESSDFLIVSEKNKEYNPRISLYYKKYDGCFASIEYLDPKKDARSLENALNFLQKQVIFSGSYQLPSYADNAYFRMNNIPQGFRVIRALDLSGREDISLSYQFAPGQWVHNVLKHTESENISDISDALDIDLKGISSWDGYIEKSRIKNPDSGYELIRTTGGVQILMISSFDSDKKIQKCRFISLYRTKKGEYAYWSWFANMPQGTPSDLKSLKNIFASLSLTGVPWLQ